MERHRKRMEENEREELLNKRFTQNRMQDDTTIYIDYSVQHQKQLQVNLSPCDPVNSTSLA